MTLKLIKSVEISHSPESLFHSVINLAQLVSPSVALTADLGLQNGLESNFLLYLQKKSDLYFIQGVKDSFPDPHSGEHK